MDEESLSGPIVSAPATEETWRPDADATGEKVDLYGENDIRIINIHKTADPLVRAENREKRRALQLLR